VMNTSFPWRANSTNLLSREFLELARAHLNAGGIFYYNTLGYDHVAYTAAHVFQHVVRYQSFVAASDAVLAPTAEERRERLLRFRGADGQPVFTRGPASAAILDQLAAAPLPDVRDELLARRDLWLITDDNMSTEFKVRY
jgi:spermidine synthase